MGPKNDLIGIIAIDETINNYNLIALKSELFIVYLQSKLSLNKDK
jgi:hypothetical protein